MRIAFIGQRGVPATFGGIEHHVEEVGSRLAQRGHDVTVYCRANYVPDRDRSYKGMRLVRLPTVSSKHLDAVVHSLLSTAAATGRGYDIIHFHALGPGVFSPVARVLNRAKVVQTIHGRDDERSKWGGAAQRMLRMAAWVSAHGPDATVVVSRHLADRYLEEYGREVAYIPNGVETAPGPHPDDEIGHRFGVRAGGYLLFVGRLVPEKAPDLLVRAFQKLDHDLRLVVVGGSSFTDDYVESLRRSTASDDRVVWAGYVYGPTLAQLYANARAFVLPSHLEGLPMTLLEAAAYDTPVVASDIPPHLEVLHADGPGRRLFAAGDEAGLVAALERSLADGSAERAGAAALGDTVRRAYRWDHVVDSLEAVYEDALGRR